jgi:hypothetical protein
MKGLHEAANLTINSNVLNDPSEIFCYFARFTDQSGKLTALRRAIQFKGVLKNQLIRFLMIRLKLLKKSF